MALLRSSEVDDMASDSGGRRDALDLKRGVDHSEEGEIMWVV